MQWPSVTLTSWKECTSAVWRAGSQRTAQFICLGKLFSPIINTKKKLVYHHWLCSNSCQRLSGDSIILPGRASVTLSANQEQRHSIMTLTYIYSFISVHSFSIDISWPWRSAVRAATVCQAERKLIQPLSKKKIKLFLSEWPDHWSMRGLKVTFWEIFSKYFLESWQSWAPPSECKWHCHSYSRLTASNYWFNH